MKKALLKVMCVTGKKSFGIEGGGGNPPLIKKIPPSEMETAPPMGFLTLSTCDQRYT